LDLIWIQSVAAIDRQLYAKYGLSEEEVAFIERDDKGDGVSYAALAGRKMPFGM